MAEKKIQSTDAGFLKFGKAPAKRDARNLKMSAILKAPVTVPEEYDFDVVHKGIPTPMFGNDKYGCCVIAGRGHQTLRFEMAEQKILISITEKDIVKEYLKESGGEDTGLVVLDSLKLWRKNGWLAGKKRYKIQAFAEIDRNSLDEVKRTVFLDIGVGLGLSLPDSFLAQFNAGKPWTIVKGRGSKPNPDNGHYVFVPGYTKLGPVCVTWGRRQQMTWEFFKKYCDEAYAIIDAIDTPKKKENIDESKLKDFLLELKTERNVEA